VLGIKIDWQSEKLFHISLVVSDSLAQPYLS